MNHFPWLGGSSSSFALRRLQVWSSGRAHRMFLRVCVSLFLPLSLTSMEAYPQVRIKHMHTHTIRSIEGEKWKFSLVLKIPLLSPKITSANCWVGPLRNTVHALSCVHLSIGTTLSGAELHCSSVVPAAAPCHPYHFTLYLGDSALSRHTHQ